MGYVGPVALPDAAGPAKVLGEFVEHHAD